MVRLYVQMVGGQRIEMQVAAERSTVAELCERIGHEFSCPGSSLKLVSSGCLLGEDGAHGKMRMTDLKDGGETLDAYPLGSSY